MIKIIITIIENTILQIEKIGNVTQEPPISWLISRVTSHAN